MWFTCARVRSDISIYTCVYIYSSTEDYQLLMVRSSKQLESSFMWKENKRIGNGQRSKPYMEHGSYTVLEARGKSFILAEVLDISENKEEVHLSFMKKCGDYLYIWPTPKDESWEPAENIVYVANFPKLVNKREQFRFPADDIAKNFLNCSVQ